MRVRAVRPRWLLLLAPLALTLAVFAAPGGASRPRPTGGAAHDEFETNISGNGSNLNAGEPQIAINPLDPKQMWMDGAAFPTPLTLGGSSPLPSTCQGWSSDDAGQTWQPAPLPQDLQFAKGSGSVCNEDGVTAFGPDGTLYAGGDTATSTKIDPSCAPGDLHFAGLCIQIHGFDPVLVSHDGGHTWGTPVYTMGSKILGAFPFAPGSGSPSDTFDRPWLVVDQSTNTVYAAAHNIADHEGFVTASTDEAQSFGTIYASDSPAYPSGGLGGSTIAAAHGQLAVAYTAAAAPGVSCPCVIFETSTDHGATFTRHVVPTRNAAHVSRPFVAADPTEKGHYALTVLDATGTQNQVYTTDDAGETWQGPALVAETPANQRFKPWLAYSPSGRLLLVWRTWHGAPQASAYDVWLAVGRDDGRHGPLFGAPVRVSTAAGSYPPSGVGAAQYQGGDDFSFVIASKAHIYVGWGDSRNVAIEQNGVTIREGGGVQIWMARLSLDSFEGHEG